MMAPDFPPIRAIIFDVDGTLINSEDIYTEIYNTVLHEYGKPDLPWTIKALQQSRGTAVRIVVSPFLHSYPPPVSPQAFLYVASCFWAWHASLRLLFHIR